MSYTVEVTREGDAWLANVLELEGAHTYARNLVALDQAVREVIALSLDLPEDVEIDEPDYKYLSDDEEFRIAVQVGERRAEVEAEQKVLAEAASVMANTLTEKSYSVRDISRILRMSPGRVSQIVTHSPVKDNLLHPLVVTKAIDRHRFPKNILNGERKGRRIVEVHILSDDPLSVKDATNHQRSRTK